MFHQEAGSGITSSIQEAYGGPHCPREGSRQDTGWGRGRNWAVVWVQQRSRRTCARACRACLEQEGWACICSHSTHQGLEAALLPKFGIFRCSSHVCVHLSAMFLQPSLITHTLDFPVKKGLLSATSLYLARLQPLEYVTPFF